MVLRGLRAPKPMELEGGLAAGANVSDNSDALVDSESPVRQTAVEQLPRPPSDRYEIA